MATENGKLMHEGSPKHLRIGTVSPKIRQRNRRRTQAGKTENGKKYTEHEEK